MLVSLLLRAYHLSLRQLSHDWLAQHYRRLSCLLLLQFGVQTFEVEYLVVPEMADVLVNIVLVLFLHSAPTIISQPQIKQRHQDERRYHRLLHVALQLTVPADHEKWLDEEVEETAEVQRLGPLERVVLLLRQHFTVLRYNLCQTALPLIHGQ